MNLNKTINGLKGEYKTAYFDILSYLQSSNISVNSKFSNEVQLDLLDMLKSAQENNLPVTDIIGKDIKVFCEDIIESHNTKKVKLLNLLKSLNFNLAFLIIIALIFQAFEGHINLNILVIFFLAMFSYGYVLNFFYKRFTLKFKGLRNKIKCILLIYFPSVLFLFPVAFLIATYVNIFINGYYMAVIGLVLVFIFHTLCKRLDSNIKWYSYLS